jgi:hypothetical protein
VHFSCVWLINWLVGRQRSGSSAPEKLPPKAPWIGALKGILAGSDELDGLFEVTGTTLDFRPEVTPAQRKTIQQSMPENWYEDADV